MQATPPVSFEFFPPNTPVGDAKLVDVVQRLGAARPEFFSVTYGAGGATRDKTLATVQAIAALALMRRMVGRSCARSWARRCRRTTRAARRARYSTI